MLGSNPSRDARGRLARLLVAAIALAALLVPTAAAQGQLPPGPPGIGVHNELVCRFASPVGALAGICEPEATVEIPPESLDDVGIAARPG